MFLFFPKFTIHHNREVEEELKKESGKYMAHNDDSGRPLQLPLAHVPGGRGANEEGGVKATIGGGGGGMGAKMGLQ